jgi:hypothetical protein
LAISTTVRQQIRDFCALDVVIRFSLIILVTLCWGHPLLAKRNDDLVVMKNGDRFTGEIKKLADGILYFKASYMLESVELDWTQVGKLESQDQFFITLKNGKRYTGLIVKPGGKEAADNTVRIGAEGKSLEIEPLDVVGIQQSEKSFWSQLNGSIDYDLSYTRGNSALSSSLGAAVEYQRTKDLVRLTTSSQFSTQSKGASTNRYTFEGQYFRQISERWFYGEPLSEPLSGGTWSVQTKQASGYLLARYLAVKTTFLWPRRQQHKGIARRLSAPSSIHSVSRSSISEVLRSYIRAYPTRGVCV